MVIVTPRPVLRDSIGKPLYVVETLNELLGLSDGGLVSLLKVILIVVPAAKELTIMPENCSTVSPACITTLGTIVVDAEPLTEYP